MKEGRGKIIIFTAVPTVLMLVLYGFLMLFSANYHGIYGLPAIEDGVLDLAGTNIAEKSIDVPLDGEWEFFFNKWIITDNIDCESDARVKMPGRWTGIEVDGRRLPASGYGSYRIKIINGEEAQSLRVFLNNAPVANRVFINGVFNSRYGELTKEIDKDRSTGALAESTRYNAEPGEELTVVVEISGTSYGGILSSMWLNTVRTQNKGVVFSLSYLPYIIAGVMLAFVGFSIIMNFGSGKGKQYFSAVLAIAALLHFMMSKDILSKLTRFVDLNYLVLLRVFNPLTAAVLIFCAVAYLVAEGTVKPDRFFLIAAPVIGGAGILTYIFLRGSYAGAASLALFALLFGLVFFYAAKAAAERRRFAKMNIAAFFVLAGILIIEYSDNLGLIVFGTDAIFTVGLVLYLLLICVLSFIKARITAQLAMNALRYEHEISVVKTHALRAQIKPHFVFNSLAAIQAVYHKGLAGGDAAMAKFSRHLRVNIDADNIDLIPFNKELENILNYFELENMRVENSLSLLLDIGCSDFELPILSLQPLIENAVRYGDTANIEDGYIQLKTERRDGKIYLSVIDNGRGFDPAEVRQGAAGLKNVRERFKYLLNAETDIQSAPGKGTVITIIIPDNKRGNNEDSDS